MLENIEKGILSIFIIFHISPIIFWKYLKVAKHIKLILVFTSLKMIGVTGGLHRLWTHKSYNTTKIIKYILSFFANASFQGSIKMWTSEHRMHHRYEESNPSLDPYSIKKGFWWAHIVSHIYKKSDNFIKVRDNIDKELIRERGDEFDNKLIKFEDEYYLILVILSGIIIPLIIFKLFFKDSLISCLMSIFVSVLITYHCTWSINSFAHLIGDKPFSREHTSVDNNIYTFQTKK